MTEWKEVLDEGFSFPNIDIFQKLKDGYLNSYVVRPKDGYVLFDINEKHYEQETPDSQPLPVNYYYLIRYLPLNHNFDNFMLVAVRRDDVEEKYIF